MMSHSLRVHDQTRCQYKGEDCMDINNLKMVKDNLVNLKETSDKIKKIVDTKQGCIKTNDYFTF